MTIENVVRREAARKGIPLSKLSLACGRAHSWLDRLFAGSGDPKLSDAIRLADELGLSIGDLAAALDGRARRDLPVTHAKSVLAELVHELSEAALKNIEVATEPSVLDRLINWWRRDDADVEHLGELRDYVDIYHPPSSDGQMKALSIGAKSLAHRTLPIPDVDTLNSILAGSAPDQTSPLVEAQRAAMETGFRCDFVKLRAPISSRDSVHIDYIRFLFRASKGSDPVVVNFSKEV